LTATLRNLRIDWFLVCIVCSAVLASILPAKGAAVPAVSTATTIMIGVLFFLYGARLKPAEALEGLTHWRLHGTILAFTYVVFPLIGLALHALPDRVLSPSLSLGMLYVCLVPSTVQSSINFTSIARGNVAGAIVSASLSNLLGVVLTPLLVIALMSTRGGLTIQPEAILGIVEQLLLPFAAGQLSRRWIAGFVARHRRLRLVDQGSILLVVYSAFSTGMREGIWHKVSVRDIVVLIALALAVLAVMLWFTWHLSGWLGFNRADQIAIQFCGTKKSLATGVPMATVLFAGSSVVGIIVLPLMIFHQAQLMACGFLAGRYARRDAAGQVRPAAR